MEFLMPGTGLVFWQIVIFASLVILLAKYAWKPILGSLKEREDSIQQALDAAEKAKSEMASLKADNENLLRQARDERDKILQEAVRAAGQLQEQRKADANKEAAKILDDAKAAIQLEKQSALREVKALVSSLSLDIAAQVLRKNLSDDATQKELVEKYLKDININ